MAAPLAEELQAMLSEIEAQRAEVEATLRPLSQAQLDWRPDPLRWSVAENLAHLTVNNNLYVPAIDKALTEARRRGLVGAGPYHYGRLGEWYVNSMEPPPRLRLRTFRVLEPPPELTGDEAIAGFMDTLDALRRAIHDATGVDLGRAHMRSPLLRVVRLSVGQALRLVLAHDRRHLWQARQVLANPHFPS